MTSTAAFAKPFAHQVAAFRLRLGTLQGTVKWDDLWQAEHDRAFVVAGAMKADLLADLAAAVDKAVSRGTTLQEFRRDFRKIVTERGWHGWTGEGTRGGEAWRTRTIYRTNMATSHAAGRHAQLRAGKYPFWVYFHGNSLEPRLQHLAWDGLILPSDHPFWDTHFPPNDWGCSCRVSGARSREAAIRRGGKADLTLPDNWAASDPKTGAPGGIGRGWAYAPGASVADTIAALAPKLDALPERPSVDLIQNWLTSEIFGRWLSDPRGSFPLVRLSAADAGRIGAERTVADLSAETALKQLRVHPELSIIDYAQAQRAVSEATRIIQDTPTSLIYVFEAQGANGYVLVVKATRTGKGLFVTSFRRLSADAAAHDRVLRRLVAKGQK